LNQFWNAFGPIYVFNIFKDNCIIRFFKSLLTRSTIPLAILFFSFKSFLLDYATHPPHRSWDRLLSFFDAFNVSLAITLWRLFLFFTFRFHYSFWWSISILSVYLLSLTNYKIIMFAGVHLNGDTFYWFFFIIFFLKLHLAKPIANKKSSDKITFFTLHERYLYSIVLLMNFCQ
jgi:hypothetical protein